MIPELFHAASGQGRSARLALLLGALAAAPLHAQVGAPAPPTATAAATAPAGDPADARLFADAARVAWRYAEQQYQPATGLINPVAWYPYATMWDVASGLGALYCAHRLGLLPSAEYETRMRRALQTLQQTRLFDGVVFNKSYSTRTGAIAGRDERDTEGQTRGYGWSALDMGRFLVWLKIIAVNDPQFAEGVGKIVARIDFSRIVVDGYLWGETVTRAGQHRRYIEGRIPYEQYGAAGYTLWGHRPEKAAGLALNSLPITVMGVPLLADRRGLDHLTSEPVVLSGLEVGWSSEMGSLAYNLLQVQEERYRRTRQPTIVSEDALPRGPFYFYYYTVNFHGSQFVVTSQGGTISDVPRWISAKATYGWHALSPSAYTRTAVDAVARASSPQRGWSSGVWERSGEPTGNENINTAAVILEAALFHARGKPLVIPSD